MRHDRLLRLLADDTVEGMNPVQQQAHTRCTMDEIERFDMLTGDRRKTLDILFIGRRAGNSFEGIMALYRQNGDTPVFRRILAEGN